MVRREFKLQLLRNFELALYSERIQRLKKEKKSLVTTARNIYRAAGATLRSSVVVLFGFSLFFITGCNINNDKGLVVLSMEKYTDMRCIYNVRAIGATVVNDHIIDAIGKYNIGDTLYFSKRK